MNVEKLKNELHVFEKELEEVKLMNEKDAIKIYNTDSKNEIIESILLEIDSINYEIEKAKSEDLSFDRLDPAFQSWEQVNAMFV